MGTCCSGNEFPPVNETDPIMINANREIGSCMNNSQKLFKQTKRMILLGSPSSGKSTIFKMVKHINANHNAPLSKTLPVQQATNYLIQGYMRISTFS